MIHLIEGVPRSGKTFLLVSMLLDLFFRWDKEQKRFYPQNDICLISNIPDLAADHIILDQAIDKRVEQVAVRNLLTRGRWDADNKQYVKVDPNEFYYEDYLEAEIQSLEDQRISLFFNHEFQQRLIRKKGKPVVYAISECQKYFGKAILGQKTKEKYPQKVFYLFEEHGHKGLTFFFDTQNRKKIHTEIKDLIEKYTVACPRTLNLGKSFRYHEYSGGKKLSTIPVVKKEDQRVFEFYRSQEIQEKVKPRPVVFKLLLLMGVLIFGFFYLINSFKSDVGPSKVEAAEHQKIVMKTDHLKKSSMEWIPVSCPKLGGKIYLVDPREHPLHALKHLEIVNRRYKCVYGTWYVEFNEDDLKRIKAIEELLSKEKFYDKDSEVSIIQSNEGFFD